MAKAATHIDKKYHLGGVWKKAYNDVASTLGGEGYAYYDIDVKKLVNPETASARTQIYLNLIVYVPKHHRHRASQHIKENITALGLNAEYKKGDYEVDVSVTDDKITKILRLQIKPEAGGGSGGGARETKRTECAQCLYASYVFNVLGGYINDEDSIDLEGLESAKKWIHVDDQIKEIMPDQLEPDWVRSCVRVANRLWDIYGGAGAKGKYKFYRGKGIDGNTSQANTIAKAYARCNKGDKKFSSEDKWNPADIWIASENYIKNGVKELDKCTNIDELNHHILSYYTSNDLIGVSLKKIESSVHWDVRNVEDFNRDPIAKVADYKFVEKQGQGGYDLQFYSSDKKSHWPMDLYIYYGPKEYNKFQARNFGSSSKGSWQIELKGSGAAQGKIGGGVVAQLLRDSGENYSGLTNLDNKAMWSRCNENHQSDKTRSDVNHDIEVLLTKYKAKDDRKGKLTCNDIASDLANRGTAYRYSKLLGLMLLDCIATSKDSDGLMRRLYIYASSQSDKSGPHVKME